jgi:hypothetical protein
MMTGTIDPVGRIDDEDDERQVAQLLVEQARAEGVDLVGPDGLLTGLTKRVLETALGSELTEHLGYEHADRDGIAVTAGANERNGTRCKTVMTQVGPVTIDVPRDRDGTFEPKIVRKRQRRLDGVDQLVLSLTARGLTTGEIAAHFAEVYGASVSKDTISRITDNGSSVDGVVRPRRPARSRCREGVDQSGGHLYARHVDPRLRSFVPEPALRRYA